jgi:hypothetical protein
MQPRKHHDCDEMSTRQHSQLSQQSNCYSGRVFCAPRSKSATSRERRAESPEHFESSLFGKNLERYDKPTAAIRVPSHCANVMPGSIPIRSFTSQKSRWYVTSPCSLKESRVIIRSWRCSGEGNDNEVPGIGKDGLAKKWWWLEPTIGELWIFRSVEVRCDIALSQWIPGKSRMLSVCSTMALRCPSVPDT